MEYILISYLVGVNLFGFALMGIDKKKAITRSFRIRERNLFLAAFIGGSLGSMIGMEFFRHKTKHKSFKIGMPMILLFQLILGAFVIKWLQ